jgi:hypothetical protein
MEQKKIFITGILLLTINIKIQMQTENLEQLRYPTGGFEFGKQYTYKETCL